MAKKLPKDLMARIKRHKDAIAAHRDALRAILDDVEQVCECADDGLQSLEYAIETLSQYV